MSGVIFLILYGFIVWTQLIEMDLQEMVWGNGVG